ncbi:MAG: OpgC domain-containing protein [Bradyrhizobium sp.]
MNIKANLALNDHDIRLNLFLGIANWSIFLDHIPNNVVNWITARNYGFSGAADLFIFISGYTAATVYAKIMLERGALIGATRIFKRVWQLYAAYIVLFTTYIVAIGYVATQYSAPDLINEFNVAGLIDHPIRILAHALFLQSKALNLDVLQLYTILMLFFAPVLWMMLRRPGPIMTASLVLYFAARQFGWNLSSFPDGDWYFNPFCWQLLFVFGAWIALNRANDSRTIFTSSIALYLGIAYLIFALVMTMAGHFSAFGHLLPSSLSDAFIPNDKENLAPYRVLHFFVMVLVVTRFIPKDWPGLKWQVFDPLVKCGEQSLAVFCIAVFLSFIGHFTLMISSGSLMAQILVSVTGIAIMTLIAYYISWSKEQDAWKAIARA